MKPPSQILITSTRVEEGHHDRVTVWNRGANAGTLTVQAGDGAEVAARLMGVALTDAIAARHEFALMQASTVAELEVARAELIRLEGLVHAVLDDMFEAGMGRMTIEATAPNWIALGEYANEWRAKERG